MRIAGVVAVSLALSACVGAGDRPQVAQGYAGERPTMAYPAPDRVTPSSQTEPAPVRIIPATPIAPAPALLVPGALTAATAGARPGPAVAALPITDAQAEAAVRAFALTCSALIRRPDQSGLTRGTDWQPSCDAARARPVNARGFLTQWFETVQVGDGRAFATGYYEPEISGSRIRRAGYDVPIYGRPRDLVDVDLGAFSDDLKGKKIRGRVDGRNFVPYYDRTAIEDGQLADRAPIIAWAADPVEVFFLQIQGSGRLRLPDGGIMRIGYDTQNGRAYTGIGALMKARGLLAPGQSSMQGIVAWLRAHPTEGQAIMRENKSFVFFRELDGGALGALGQPVTGRVSAAADPKFLPLGVPVYLSLDRTDATGVWIVQDTGGAIKGANRFDTFWGAGDLARATAGGMAARGTAFLLLPVGTVARLNGERGVGGTIPSP